MIGDLKTMIRSKPKDKPKAYRGVQSYLTEDQIAILEKNCLSIEIFSASVPLMTQLYGLSTEWGIVQ